MWSKEIRDEITKVRRHDSMIRDPLFCSSEVWRTEAQWSKAGYGLKKKAKGLPGYIGGQMNERCVRYHRLEVFKRKEKK